MKYEEKSLKTAAKITAASLSESGELSKESALAAAKFFKNLYRITAEIEYEEDFSKAAFKAAGKITAAAYEEAEKPCGKAAGEFFAAVYEGLAPITESEDFDKDLFKYCGKITAAACEEMEEPTLEKAAEAVEFFTAIYEDLSADHPDGEYRIRESEAGFSFRLVSAVGESLGYSEVYTSKAGAEKGAASVKKNAPIAEIEDQTADEPEKKKNPKFEIFKDKTGTVRYRLKAANGEIILVSGGGLISLNHCLDRIEKVRSAANGDITEE